MNTCQQCGDASEGRFCCGPCAVAHAEHDPTHREIFAMATRLREGRSPDSRAPNPDHDKEWTPPLACVRKMRRRRYYSEGWGHIEEYES